MRSIAIVFFILPLLFSVHQTHGKVICVPGDSSTIQEGINGAVKGDTVLVERGCYHENIDFSGKAILVASHFIFTGSESTIDSTIIDGDSLGSVVTFDSGEDSNSVIRGFTIRGGYAEYGGGILCYGSSPVIMENFVVENACQEAHGGPGIYCWNGSQAQIYRNVVARCAGPGAIGVRDTSDPRVINNTVCDNTWGGISIISESNPYVKNNIFCNNVSYGVHVGSAWAVVLYNDVFGQDEDYAGLIPDLTGINGNISTDPLFVNSAVGDYHLTEESPCIDAGDPPGTDMGAFEYFIRGDANGDGVVDPADVVYLINYLFRNGPVPNPLMVGDVNCDGEVGPGDIVYLINYLFRGGPPPCDQ
jgi:parallel beta-helix repeat protein